METLIIEAESKKIKAIKSFLEAFEVTFRTGKDESPYYNPEFVDKIKKAEQEVEKGNTVTIADTDNIWESILSN